MKAGDTATYGHYLDLAIDHYAQGMQLDLNDYYPSCNLPRLYRARGEDGDAELANVAAQIAYFACVRARERNPHDEWINPTLLGAAFDAGDVAVAKDCVKRVRKDGTAIWKLETTLNDIDLSVSQVQDPQRRDALGALRDQLLQRRDRIEVVASLRLCQAALLLQLIALLHRRRQRQMCIRDRFKSNCMPCA